MYLGLTPVVSNWSAAGDEFSLLLESNPLTEFVELPPGHANLNYSAIMCGVLRGALEMVWVLLLTYSGAAITVTNHITIPTSRHTSIYYLLVGAHFCIRIHSFTYFSSKNIYLRTRKICLWILSLRSRSASVTLLIFTLSV